MSVNFSKAVSNIAWKSNSTLAEARVQANQTASAFRDSCKAIGHNIRVTPKVMRAKMFRVDSKYSYQHITAQGRRRQEVKQVKLAMDAAYLSSQCEEALAFAAANTSPENLAICAEKPLPAISK